MSKLPDGHVIYSASCELINKGECIPVVTSCQPESEPMVDKSKFISALWKRITTVCQSDNVAEIGRRFGVTRHAAYKWERGENPPELLKLIEFARSNNVSLDWLLTGEGPMEASVDISFTLMIRFSKLYEQWSRLTDPQEKQYQLEMFETIQNEKENNEKKPERGKKRA